MFDTIGPDLAGVSYSTVRSAWPPERDGLRIDLQPGTGAVDPHPADLDVAAARIAKPKMPRQHGLGRDRTEVADTLIDN